MSTKSLAVIGSGPSAMYTVKYVLKQIPSLKIDIFEKLSEPFGLVRFGVAPDHPEVKNVAHEFRDMLETNSNIRMHLNHHITDLRDIRASHSAVLVGIGAQGSKTIPSDFHPHQSARDFVLWYNGHPEGHRPEISAEKCGIVSIVGMGNVALDVARLLSKKSDALSLLKKNGLTMEAIEWMTERQKAPHQKKVQIFARRGYPEAVFTNKEFRELLNVDGAVAVVNPSDLGESLEEIARKVEKDRGKKRGLEILEVMINNFYKAKTENVIQFKFNTENIHKYYSDLLISSVGFQVQSFAGLPMESGISVANVKGRVIGHYKGIYVVGWAKRGPKGNIASNIADARETAAAIVEDI